MGGIFAYPIAESVEPVLQKSLACDFAFAGIKCRFNVKQRNSALVAQMRNGDVLCLMRSKTFGDDQDDGITLKCAEWTWMMNDPKQLASTLSFQSESGCVLT